MTTTSGASTADLAAIAGKLRQRAQAHLWMAVGQLAVGIAATFVLPVILLRISPGMPWGLFWIILAVVIAFMYGCEWWTRGDYYLQQAQYMRRTHWYSGTYSVRGWADLEARAFAVYWEVLLFAPRQVFEGWTWLRCLLVARQADPMRAAAIVGTLLARREALPIKDLTKPNEAPLGFDRAIAHLLVHEWVGVGEAQGGQIWLTTESREALRPG